MRLASAALITAVACQARAVPIGDGLDRSLVVQNRSRASITAVYVAVPGAADWSNVLERQLDTNDDIVIDLNNGGWSCVRHVRVITSNDETLTRDNVDVCNIANIVIR